MTCGFRGGQGRGRTADLPIFSRSSRKGSPMGLAAHGGLPLRHFVILHHLQRLTRQFGLRESLGRLGHLVTSSGLAGESVRLEGGGFEGRPALDQKFTNDVAGYG